MAVVVRNERNRPFYFGAGSNRVELPVGQVATISESEWEAVPIALRGAGKINALWPMQSNSTGQKLKFEQYVTNGVYETRYIGNAMQDAIDTDPTWTVKRLSHSPTGPTTNAVSEIQTLSGVAWSNRATLPWT